jgi:hypothetical protein
MSLRNMYKSETLASASQYYIYRQRSYIAFTLRQKHKTMANLFKKSVSSVVITVFHDHMYYLLLFKCELVITDYRYQYM